MLKKRLWLVFCGLLVVALVLSSCQPAAVEEEKTTETVTGQITEKKAPTVGEKEEEAVVEEKGPEMVTDALGRLVEKPRYGGGITFQLSHEKATDYFDPVISAIGGHLASVTYDKLVTGDWYRGPSGTGENSFIAPHIPDYFRIGHLSETYEVPDISTVIFHIRQGVHFQNVPPVNGREMTAYDVVYSYRRGQEHPKFTAYRGSEEVLNDWLADKEEEDPEKLAAWLAKLEEIGAPVAAAYMTALDKWTVEYKLYEPSSGILGIASWMYVIAKESIDTYGDLMDWRNACGTGAWMVEDSVSGSSVTWSRNPNYWMSDPFHLDNKLPYADTLRGLIIPETATSLAALRTHKLDITGVEWDKATSMKETNPELLNKLMSPTGTRVIFMRTDIEPFSDVKVRQALALAVDQPKIVEEFFQGNAFVNTWPCQPGNVDGYTPLEDLPDAIRELYEYHPDKAKALLAEAGYPNGFKTECIIYPSDLDVDLLLIVKEYLAEAGIDMEVKVIEPAAHSSMIYGMNYPAMCYSYWGNASPESAFGWAHGGVTNSIYAFSKVIDPIAEDTFEEWKVIEDSLEASKVLKAEYIREMGLVWEVPLPAPSWYLFWAPWLKNYSGELCLGLTSEMGATEIYRYMWVDQDLKYEYTGQR